MLALFLRSKKSLKRSLIRILSRKKFQLFVPRDTRNLEFLHLRFRSRYISRYVNLKFSFLPFVVVTLVARVFFSAVFAARAPAIGSSADRAWQLSQLVEGVLTACDPSHGSLSCVETNCVSFASTQARKLNHSVCFSFPHKVATLWGPQLWPDVVCPNRLGCPRCVSRSPEARFRVAAHAVRVSHPAV